MVDRLGRRRHLRCAIQQVVEAVENLGSLSLILGIVAARDPRERRRTASDRSYNGAMLVVLLLDSDAFDSVCQSEVFVWNFESVYPWSKLRPSGNN